MRFPRGWVLSLFCFLFMSCFSYHVIMCISFAYVFVSCIRAFSPSSVLQSCCNTPDVTFHICNSNSCHFRICAMIFPPWLGFVFVLHFFHACISYHVIMCIAVAYVFVSSIRAFSPLSVLDSGAPISSGAPLLFRFVCGC